MIPRLHVVALIAVVCGCLLVCCQPTQTQKDLAQQQALVDAKKKHDVAQATANLEPIGQHLATVGRVAEGDAVVIEAKAIDRALDIVEKPPATVSFAEWQAAKDDAEKAKTLAKQLADQSTDLAGKLDAEKKKADDLQKKVNEEAKTSGFGILKTSGFWLSAAGVATYLASLFGGPVGGAAGKLISMLLPHVVGPIQQRASTAATAVMASDAARTALGMLEAYIQAKEPETWAKLVALIEKATAGKASTPEELFVLVAKGVAIDEGAQGEIDKLLTDIRDKACDTELGCPTSITTLMTTMKAA